MKSSHGGTGSLDIAAILPGIAEPSRELSVLTPDWGQQLSFLPPLQRIRAAISVSESESDLLPYDEKRWGSEIDLITRLTANTSMMEFATPVPLSVRALSGGRAGPTLLLDFGNSKEVMKIYRQKSADDLLRRHLLTEFIAPQLG